MKVDYSIKDPQERVMYVDQILANTPEEERTPSYLKYLTDYLLFVNDSQQTKKEKKNEYPVITRNRRITHSKRETSMENLISSSPTGEDGIYSLLADPSKYTILDPKDPISDEDLETSKAMRQVAKNIETLKKKLEKATGLKRYTIKQQIIECWQQLYELKGADQVSPSRTGAKGQIRQLASIELPGRIWLDSNDMPVMKDSIIDLFNYKHIAFLLEYYSLIKEETWDKLDSDLHWVMLDLDDIAEEALRPYPFYQQLLIWKIDGLTNAEIRQAFLDQGEDHSEQYYSTTWRTRIPKLIAKEAQKRAVIWWFTNIEYGEWQECGKCGKILPLHNLFFARNTNKKGFYSICKDCKNHKGSVA